jgi:hypothetical protein
MVLDLVVVLVFVRSLGCACTLTRTFELFDDVERHLLCYAMFAFVVRVF